MALPVGRFNHTLSHMPDVSIMPIPKGIDQFSPDTSMPKGTARDALNVDIDRAGNFARRDGFAIALAGANLHSLHSHDDNAYVCQANALCLYTAPSTLTPVITLPSAQPVQFHSSESGLYFCQTDCVGVIDQLGARLIGVPDGNYLGALPADVGGLEAGRYGVAYSYCFEFPGRAIEEGSLGPITFLQIAAGSGIRANFPAAPIGATHARIYRTDANGESLHLVSHIPTAIPSYLLGRSSLGRNPTTRGTRRIRGGHAIRYWKGRLLIARDNVLGFSMPMNYGLEDVRSGFVQFPARITFIEGVEGGVFIGQPNGVAFLAGTRPDDWSMRQVSAVAPVPGSSAYIDAYQIDSDMQLNGKVAVWLSASGYAVGTADGVVIYPQGKRINIPAVTSGHTCVLNQRATTLTL